jgi:hypothetical protein
MPTHPVTHTIMIDNPELEEHYRKYESVAGLMDEQEAMAEVLLGNASYVRRFKMPKYNGPVSMLREPKVAVRYMNQLGIPSSKTAHSDRATYMNALVRTLDQAWQKLVTECAEMFGDHGPTVSGVYRSHFPEGAKNRLRFLAHGMQMAAEAERLHDFLTKTRSPLFSW